MAGLEVWDSRGMTFFALDQSPLSVGRNGSCELVICDDDTVSRKHAMLELLSGVWQIHDLGSQNGTWVNGVRLFG